jgi:Zn-dependent protease with chaperone function
MTQDQFDALIGRLEQYAAGHPRVYRLRLFLVALLGYAYIFLVLALSLVATGIVVWSVVSHRLSAGFVLAKVAFALLLFAGLILRAIWVRMPEPEGLFLDRNDGSPLFETVAELGKVLNAPKVHKILLSGDLNAGIAQVAKLGVFGWYTNYLTVGLPLMLALSPEQFRAVLAHEFGHLSSAHGKFQSWIYRSRAMWEQLPALLIAVKHWGSAIFVKFFQWYAPYFAAYSFVLARAQEYEADRLATIVAGKEATSEALVMIEVVTAWMTEKFWPSVFGQAVQQADPPSEIYSEMRQALSVALPEPRMEKWLAWSLFVGTGSGDTHPCLSERLSALGQEAHLPRAVKESAADHFLGDSLARLTTTLSAEWKTNVSSTWQQLCKRSRESQEGLAELEKRAQSETLTVDDAWMRAWWTEELHGSESAMPLYQRVLEIEENHAAALFSVGRILLSEECDDGVELIKRAVLLDGQYVIPAFQVVCPFLIENGKKDEWQAFIQQVVAKAPQPLALQEA